jgi:hypothetical protein
MGIWDAVTGRQRLKGPQLDSLFAVPSAAVTLEASAGFRPTGAGSVCYRAGLGAALTEVESEVRSLVPDDPQIPDDLEFTADDFGFTWMVSRRSDGDMAALCTDLHAVNTILESQGFATGLLCTVVPFADPVGRRFGLVYLYKRGTFYAFAPTGAQERDNLLEIQIRDTLAAELPMEPEFGQWLAVWGAPGLDF